MASRMFYFSPLFMILVLLPWSHAGCKEDLQQDYNMNACLMGFVAYISKMNMGDSVDGSGLFKAICSEEGKAAFGCLFKYMQQCPELLKQPDGSNPMTILKLIPDFDLSTFMDEGGFEAACAMLVGPCSGVKDCFPVVPKGGRRKREVSGSINYYRLFQLEASETCGEMKAKITCVLDALEQCPKSDVDQVEKQVETALKKTTLGFLSFKETKLFVQNECPKIPAEFAQDQCITNIVMSKNFTNCTAAANSQYSQARNCSVYALSVPCVEDLIKPACGSAAADLFSRNTHVVFPGIPTDCGKFTQGSYYLTTPSRLQRLLLSKRLSRC